jgi:hypothetical protein
MAKPDAKKKNPLKAKAKKAKPLFPGFFKDKLAKADPSCCVSKMKLS